MYKRFSPVKTIILNIVTCGIYSMVMWASMTKAHNKMAQENEIATIKGFVAAFFLGIITCDIYLFIWQYKHMKQVNELAAKKGVALTPTSNPVALFFLCFVPIYSFIVVCANHNALCDAYEA